MAYFATFKEEQGSLKFRGFHALNEDIQINEEDLSLKEIRTGIGKCGNIYTKDIDNLDQEEIQAILNDPKILKEDKAELLRQNSYLKISIQRIAFIPTGSYVKWENQFYKQVK